MKREFAGQVAGIGLVSSNHVMVEFGSCVEVYNLYMGELVLRQEFQRRVVAVRCNTHRENVNFVERFEKERVFVGVGLEGGQVDVLVVKRTGGQKGKEYDLRFMRHDQNDVCLEKVRVLRVFE